MIATYDFVGGADLPGELAELPDWEAVSEPECGLCWQAGTDTDTGLCRVCRERVPQVGGCGRALALVAALSGGDTDAPLVHLTRCGDCREFFGTLAAVERVADMETPHAAVLAGCAA
jgi:hypothetical protein